MNISYTADAKHAVDKINSEMQKIEIMRIFNDLRWWASHIDDDLFLMANACAEAFANHMVYNLNFSHRETGFYAV